MPHQRKLTSIPKYHLIPAIIICFLTFCRKIKFQQLICLRQASCDWYVTSTSFSYPALFSYVTCTVQDLSPYSYKMSHNLECYTLCSCGDFFTRSFITCIFTQSAVYLQRLDEIEDWFFLSGVGGRQEYFPGGVYCIPAGGTANKDKTDMGFRGGHPDGTIWKLPSTFHLKILAATDDHYLDVWHH